MTTVNALLTVYDQQMRGAEPKPPARVRDGPLLRAAGGHRGYISGPRDIGVTGAELDLLIARQRDHLTKPGIEAGKPFRESCQRFQEAVRRRLELKPTG